MVVRCPGSPFLMGFLFWAYASTVVESLRAPTRPQMDKSSKMNKSWVDYMPRYGDPARSGTHSDGLSMSSFNSTIDTAVVARGESKEAAERRAPRSVFLFLTRTGLENEDMWEAFFSGADKHTYQVFVHCVESQNCTDNFKKRNHIGMRQVETVPTEYCTNLMSAMVQLLKEALQYNANKGDKFVFLSESTLPVKPFSHVHHELTKHAKSDLCIHRSQEWPRGVDCHVVKHSQWSVLNRNHAQIVTQNWAQIFRRYKDHTFTVPMLDPERWKIQGVRTMHDSRLCTDEWGVFASIYGAVPFHSKLQDPNLNPDPLKFDAIKPQGICHTFAFWSADKSSEPEVDLVRSLGDSWPATRMDCNDAPAAAEAWEFPKCHETHPVTITSLDENGARVMRDSQFLFIRKFKTGVVNLATFKKELLRPQASSENSTWFR